MVFVPVTLTFFLAASYVHQTSCYSCCFSSASARWGWPLVRQPHRFAVTQLSASIAIWGNNEKEETGRRARKEQERRREYEGRRDAWLNRYGTLEALEYTFGAGPPWGDLNPEETRALYHTLLPRSLLGLHEMGLMKPEELAPLAYEARIAAKEYARSRCMATGRLATVAFDQYRNLRDRGQLRLGSSSMSWEEVWQKYEGQIVQEECTQELNGKAKKAKGDVTMRIYLRILERSCATNQAFDSLFLKQDAGDNNLLAMASQLETDVRAVLLHPKESAKAQKEQQRVEDKQQKAERKEEKKMQDAQKKQEKVENKQQKDEAKDEKKRQKAEKKGHRQKPVITSVQENNAGIEAALVEDAEIPTLSQRRKVLRIMASARRQLCLLQGKNATPLN